MCIHNEWLFDSIESSERSYLCMQYGDIDVPTFLPTTPAPALFPDSWKATCKTGPCFKTSITRWYSRIWDLEYKEDEGLDYQERAVDSVIDEERWLADREVA